jgi:hypothetical protein
VEADARETSERARRGAGVLEHRLEVGRTRTRASVLYRHPHRCGRAPVHSTPPPREPEAVPASWAAARPRTAAPSRQLAWEPWSCVLPRPPCAETVRSLDPAAGAPKPAGTAKEAAEPSPKRRCHPGRTPSTPTRPHQPHPLTTALEEGKGVGMRAGHRCEHKDRRTGVDTVDPKSPPVASGCA